MLTDDDVESDSSSDEADLETDQTEDQIVNSSIIRCTKHIKEGTNEFEEKIENTLNRSECCHNHEESRMVNAGKQELKTTDK